MLIFALKCEFEYVNIYIVTNKRPQQQGKLKLERNMVQFDIKSYYYLSYPTKSFFIETTKSFRNDLFCFNNPLGSVTDRF